MSEERRKEIAMALAIRDGYQPEDFVDWQKTIYAKRADEIIGQEVGEFTDAPCEKCGGRGFTEQEHGLVRVFCDCEKGKELSAEVTGEISDVVEVIDRPDLDEDVVLMAVAEVEGEGEALPEITVGANKEYEWEANFEVTDDSNSGAGQPDKDTGSGDTSQPQLKQKPKSKKKARKKSS